MITGMANAAPMTNATSRYVKKPSPGRMVMKCTPESLPAATSASTASQVIELKPGMGMIATMTPTTTASVPATSRPRSSSRCSRRVISLSPGACCSGSIGLGVGAGGGVSVIALGACGGWCGTPYVIRTGAGSIVSAKQSRSLRSAVLVQVVHRILDGPNFLGVLVADLDVELFFERHDQLDQVKR